MAILDLIQNVTRELGIKTPESVVGSSNLQARQLLELTQRAGKDVTKNREWPQLTKEASITLVASQESYTLPPDLDTTIFQTHWDQDNTWPLLGPLTPQQWQRWQNGVVSAGPRIRFRIKGFADKTFFLDPTPSTGDAGKVLVFEYTSKSWIKPRTWVASNAFSAGEYCFNNGNNYFTSSGGTTGSTAPTHTSGTVSDGAVDWTYEAGAYTRFRADTDETHLNQDILELDLIWRMRRARGLEYRSFRVEAEDLWDNELTSLTSAPIVNMGGQRAIEKFITTANVPDTGYGA